MRAFCLLILFLALPTFSFAQLKEGIRCVQDQLTEAGFDPGVVDGEVGPKTRRALAEFQNETGLVFERTLDVSLGNSVCRSIGLIRPALQQYWPSLENGRPEIIFSDSIEPGLKGRMLASVIRSSSSIARTFQVDLAGQDVILVADNPRDLARLVATHLQVGVIDQSTAIADACGSSRGISGLALPGIMCLCVSNDADLRAQIDQTWLDFLVAREMVHLMQFQLTGGVPTEQGVEEQLLNEGPVWLNAGSAQAYGNKFAINTPDWDYRIVNYRRLKNVFPDLSELETSDALASRQPDVYRAGTVAAIDLVDLYGYPAFGQFYQNLGRGVGWTNAFELAFGLPPESFYKHYRNVTRFEASGDPIQGPLSILSE